MQREQGLQSQDQLFPAGLCREASPIPALDGNEEDENRNLQLCS